MTPLSSSPVDETLVASPREVRELVRRERKRARRTKPVCCYAGCNTEPHFTVWLAFKAEHGGERCVQICARHAAFLTLNDSFVPAATFAGQDIHDAGPWADWTPGEDCARRAGRSS